MGKYLSHTMGQDADGPRMKRGKNYKTLGTMVNEHMAECGPKIAALEAALKEAHETAEGRLDKIKEVRAAYEAQKKRAEAAEARVKALEACHRTCDDGHEVGCPLSPSSAPAQPCRGEVLCVIHLRPWNECYFKSAPAGANPDHEPCPKGCGNAVGAHAYWPEGECPPKKPAEACQHRAKREGAR